MPALTSYTKPLSLSQAEKLRALLKEKGFEFQTKPYCLYAAAGDKVNVAVYEKGPKIVVQGKGAEHFITFLLEPEVLGVAELGYEEVQHPEMFSPHIGVDESGKGDFLGPLVIAGVYVDEQLARNLRAIGVMDSKRIGNDARIEKLAQEMRGMKGLVHQVIVMGPQSYNELYGKFGNLNKMLAWGHARIIENLLERVPDCPRALSDQFANPRVLQSAMQARGKNIILEQRTKAESDPAVAAASIFAREGFVRWMKQKGDALGITLPKGASPAVKQAARELVRQYGRPILDSVAKMHFKTAQEI